MCSDFLRVLIECVPVLNTDTGKIRSRSSRFRVSFACEILFSKGSKDKFTPPDIPYFRIVPMGILFACLTVYGARNGVERYDSGS